MNAIPKVTPKPLYDPQAVIEAVRLLIDAGQITELRALEATTAKDRWSHTASGYFDDAEKLAAALETIKTAKGIYIVPNPVDPALLARAANRIRKTPKGESTQHSNIVHRRWLLVDIDAQRPSGISATEAEHERSLERARMIYAHLRDLGWPDPIAADSGNGAHLLYRIDVATDDGGLVERCLKALAALFDDDAVKVDQTVFNPSRIWKLYGTLACKGDDTLDRPHRMARIIDEPDTLDVVPLTLLEQLSDRIHAAESSVHQGLGEAFDVQGFIDRNALDVAGPFDWQGHQGRGTRWTFNTSPMCDHHDDGPYIIQHASGAISAQCHHNSCSWTWHELRAKYEPRHKRLTFDASQPLCTDMGNAERFARQHGDALRFVHSWDKWLCWTGQRWQLDATGRVVRMAKKTARSIFGEAKAAADTDEAKKLAKWAISSQSVARIDAMIKLAKSEQPFPVSHNSLDADPWLLNVENGTIDLRTCELLPHSRGDLLTGLVPVCYDENADCALWCRFLDQIMDGNRDLTRYLSRLVGYSLTGVVEEHVLPIMWGEGANGKSSFVNVILALMGPDYSTQAPHKLLIQRRHDEHETQKTQLFRRRFVAAVETDRNDLLSEALVKSLTGGDPIIARRMREDHWQFQPTHTLWMATNHRPRIRGTDLGIWRRIKLIPFIVSIPADQQDARLPEKLKAELPGILNWALMGCAEWLEHGLQEPSEVTRATDEYRHDSDYFGQFLEACCEIGNVDWSCRSSDLFTAYSGYGGSQSQTAFGKEMKSRGFEKKKSGGRQFYRGIRLLGTVGDSFPVHST